MGTNRNILRPGQKERLRRGAIQGSCYYNHFLKDMVLCQEKGLLK